MNEFEVNRLTYESNQNTQRPVNITPR